MAFVSDYSNIENVHGQELAYDLRQIYAKLVGEHMEDIAIARKADHYINFYKALDDLHTIIQFKFKNQEEDEKEYKTKMMNVAILANKHIDVWLGKHKDPLACDVIENALKEVESFLYFKMNAASMFGSSRKIEGL